MTGVVHDVLGEMQVFRRVISLVMCHGPALCKGLAGRG